MSTPPQSWQTGDGRRRNFAPIRLLIVDDSSFMRMALRKMVEADPAIEVVGEARDGVEAVALAGALRPDVVTMDVEMPRMNGIDATREILRDHRCAIFVISTLTQEGTEMTLQALAAGAVDYISKQSSLLQMDIAQISHELLEKIHCWAREGASPGATAARTAPAKPAPAGRGKRLPKGRVGIVVIGVSTGGPAILPHLFNAMGRLCCPVVVAQHMPATFTPSFARQLARDTGLQVVEGYFGLVLEAGVVVIAPGGTDLEIREAAADRLILSVQLRAEMPVHPSVDVLFRSVAALSLEAVAVLLTGMGSDGVQGAVDLVRRKDCPVLAQTPASCVVDGMPSAAIAAGVVSETLSVTEIGKRIAGWAGA